MLLLIAWVFLVICGLNILSSIVNNEDNGTKLIMFLYNVVLAYYIINTM